MVYANSGPGSAARQAEALEQEGVIVRSDSMNEFYVDMARFGWFPDRLPNEEDEGELDARIVGDDAAGGAG